MEYPEYDKAKNDYTLIKVNYPEHRDEIGRLRYMAWKDVEGINKDFFAKGYWIDELDKSSDCWIIKYEDKIVASGRLSIHFTLESIPWYDKIPKKAMAELKLPIASINRLVVHPDFRKNGLSKPLDEIRIMTAKENKELKTIIAEPVVSRFEVLEEQGFKDYGIFGKTPELPGVLLGFKMLHL
ncbi:MAG: GNAT family N-acetyltransferase [Salinivirgaceae bacterium]|nr:GNAT family N-acetyltransferase [Salinivirgaceae bacterium]